MGGYGWYLRNLFSALVCFTGWKLLSMGCGRGTDDPSRDGNMVLEN